MSRAKDPVSRRLGSNSRTIAERVTLAISLVLLGLLIGGLTWLSLTQGAAPPSATVSADWKSAERRGDTWYLPITVTNDGDMPTDWLRVEAVQGDTTREMEWEYVAGGATVTGSAAFDEQPTSSNTDLSVTTITDP